MEKILKLMSNESLVSLYKKGDKQVLEAIYEKNKNFIHSRALKLKSYYNHTLDFEDLMQEGFLGLKKAVEKFDENQGTKLITYAQFWVDQSIKRAILEKGFLIRVPVHIHEKTVQMFYTLKKHKDATFITLEELAEELGVESSSIKQYYEILQNYIFTGSLDGNLEVLVHDKTQSQENYLEQQEIKDKIESGLNKLCKRERDKDIIKTRFGLENGKEITLGAAGKYFELSRERIRQIEQKFLKGMRRELKDYKMYCKV